MRSIHPSNLAFRPISGANAITVAIVLYKSHFRQYLGISGIATLWVFIPIIIIPFLILLGLGITVGMQPSIFTQVNPRLILSLVLLVLAWIVVLFWCSGKSLRNVAMISRLAYQELAGQPETPRVSRQHLRSAWSFFWTQFLVGVILQVVNWGLQTGFLSISNNLKFIQSAPLPFALGTWLQISLYVILFLALTSAYFWFFARFFIPEVIVAVESQNPAVSAVGRSWSLTEGSSIRMLVAVSLATGITMPIYTLCLIPIGIGIGMGARLFQESIIPRPEGIALVVGLTILIGFVSLLVINIIVVPFWQALKAVLYYDLRVRREGLGLILTEEPENQPQ